MRFHADSFGSFLNVDKTIYLNMTKVLYMCEWTGRGIHPVWLQYAYGLRQAGVDIYAATSGREYDPGTLQEAEDHNLKIVELPEFFDRSNNFRGAKRSLAKWLSSNSVDVIHCQGFRELYDVTRACRINRQKHRIVMTDRNSLAWTGLRAMKRIALLLYEKTWIIALSQSHYDKLRRIPRMSNRTVFIPNGVNTNIFHYIARPCKSNDHIARLMYPASFTPFKGHSALIDLCKELVLAGRQFELLLAGYGPMEDSVRRKINSMGLSDHVKQLGRVPWKKLPELYSTCDIGVFPSLSEMMPNAILEMMSSGLPVVAYDTGGIHHMIEHGKTGFLTKVGDQKSFRKYLEKLMDNPHLARNLGDAASEKMKADFSIDVISRRTLDLYNSLCVEGKEHRT